MLGFPTRSMQGWLAYLCMAVVVPNSADARLGNLFNWSPKRQLVSECPAGKILGANECLDCPSGTYVDSTVHTACLVEFHITGGPCGVVPRCVNVRRGVCVRVCRVHAPGVSHVNGASASPLRLPVFTFATQAFQCVLVYHDQFGSRSSRRFS